MEKSIHAHPIEELIESLRRLPGIGPKAAQRIAYQLLDSDRESAVRLGNALLTAAQTVHHCPKCNNLTDSEICRYCSSPQRDDALLCVVETVADMMKVEQSLVWLGRYFVLQGRISPVRGRGPHELGFDRLLERVSDGLVKEVVIATSFTPEGEATAVAIREALHRRNPDIKVSRIARGVPAGTELEYTDLHTIAQALVHRRENDD
jgi:recombination protein RecR